LLVAAVLAKNKSVVSRIFFLGYKMRLRTIAEPSKREPEIQHQKESAEGLKHTKPPQLNYAKEK